MENIKPFWILKNILLLLSLCLFTTTQVYASDWYKKGTLQNATALEWQKATQENKVATCAYFISFFWSKDKLSTEIANNIKGHEENLRAYSTELAKQIDTVFAPESNAKKNKDMYANQKVNETAVILMYMMEWIHK